MPNSVRRSGTIWGGFSVLFAFTVLGAGGYIVVQEKANREANAPPVSDETLLADSQFGVGSDDEGEGQGILIETEEMEGGREVSMEHRKDFYAGRVINSIPATESEIESAFNRSLSYSCSILPPGEAKELSSFTPYLINQDRAHKRPVPAIRRHALSVGLDVARRDQKELPVVSRSMILSYLRDHYVSIQPRIQKDPLTYKLYFGTAPLAGLLSYGGASVTQPMEKATIAAVRDFRSAGLFVPADVEHPGPEQLRTLVLIQKYMLSPLGDRKGTRAQAEYELVFFHGQQTSRGFQVHVFVTTDRREKIHYLGRSRRPRNPKGCDIYANVFFDKYSHGSLVPLSGVVRSHEVDGDTIVSMESVHEYLQGQEEQVDFWSRPDVALNAIIEGQLR